MVMMKLNHWYIDDNELSISLMRFYASITICKNNEFIFYKLNVIDENRGELTFNFYSLNDAVRFTEVTINKCWTKEEILEAYKKQIEQKEFKDIPKRKIKK